MMLSTFKGQEDEKEPVKESEKQQPKALENKQKVWELSKPSEKLVKNIKTISWSFQ